MSDSIYVQKAESTGFAQVPFWIIHEASPAALKLWCLLYEHADWTTGKTNSPISRAVLAQRIGYSKTATVDRYIEELVLMGAVSVVRSRREGSKEMNPNRYLLHFQQPSEVVPEKGLPSPQKRTEVVPANGQIKTIDKTKDKDSAHPVDAPLFEAPSKPAVDHGAEFENWWKQYPRKEDKKSARLEYVKARRHHSEEWLLDQLTKWVVNANREGWPIPYGVRWLKNERWMDEAAQKSDPFPQYRSVKELMAEEKQQYAELERQYLESAQNDGNLA